MEKTSRGVAMKESEKNEMERDSDSKCPSQETVSSYYDGELDADSLDARHIKNCPACSEHLKYFAKLATDLKKEMSFFTPDGYTESLREVLKKRVKQEVTSPPLSFPFLLKISAMFAGAALIIITLLTDDGKCPAIPSFSRSADPIVFLGDAKNVGSKEMTSLPVPSSDANGFADSTIDMSNFHHVATGANTGVTTRFKPTTSTKVDKPKVIMANVRQTWSVSDLGKAEKVFRRANATFVKNKDGNLRMNVVLTKKELANLVRASFNAGFKLLSPAQPQPEQKVFEGDSDTKVSYTAILVQR